jgi:hypothetical protein
MQDCPPYESLSVNRKGLEKYVFEDEDDDENDFAFSLDRSARSLAARGGRIAANPTKSVAVELHNQSVCGLMRSFIDMPVWTQKEKLDGEMPRFLIEGSPAAVDRVVAHPMYDLAARRAVWQNLDDAGRVTHILPFPYINRANNRVVALIDLDHVGDLIDREN